MKKWIALSTVLVATGFAVAAGGMPSRSTPLSRGTVLNPFTLQVVSVSSVQSIAASRVSSEGVSRPQRPVIDDETTVNEGAIRPGPFTPPPRSPYAPPPR